MILNWIPCGVQFVPLTNLYPQMGRNMLLIVLTRRGFCGLYRVFRLRRRSPKGFKEIARVANEGGDVARVAREQLEQSLGRPVVTGQKAFDYIHPIEDAEAKVLPKGKNTPDKNTEK